MSHKKRYEKYGLREEAQDYITNYMSIPEPVSLAKIQERVYKKAFFKFDSRQQEVIKEAIKHTRKEGVDKWRDLCKDPAFCEAIDAIKKNYSDSIEKELASKDYAEYKAFMDDPVKSAGRRTGLDEKTLAAIAIYWKQWVARLSRQKMNIVITKGGPRTKYYIPSFWKWSIRENKTQAIKWNTAVKGHFRATDANVELSYENQNWLEITPDELPVLEDNPDETEEKDNPDETEEEDF